MRKKSNRKNPMLGRCGIDEKQVRELNDDPSAIGEGFYITLLSDDLARVENILLCGLGVGDIIRVRSGDAEKHEHPNMFVSVVERKCKVVFVPYSLVDHDTLPEQFPTDAIAFMQILEHLHIKCEPVTKGWMAIQYPIAMRADEFLRHINCGPFKFV